ncbi:MAG: hypothetical protein H7175_08845, partial [Burkholderiales bacterium]|nr:hypothetical protein [Anaerolineae bacterium]
MGEDWRWMRVPPQNLAEIKQLIAEQALSYRQWGDGFLDDLHLFVSDMLADEDQQRAAFERYSAASQRLRELLIFLAEDVHRKSGPPAFIHRASVIGRNYLFPEPMRIATYRTYLPEEVPAQLKLWRDYVFAVRNGKYSGYLFHSYLHRESKNTLEFWNEMQFAIDRARSGTYLSAVRVNESSLPDKVRAIPKPVGYPLPAPRWADWEADQTVYVPENDERYAALQSLNHEL